MARQALDSDIQGPNRGPILICCTDARLALAIEGEISRAARTFIRVSGGDECIKELESGSYGALILEWELPNDGAAKVLAWLTSRESLEWFPRIVIAGSVDNESIFRAYHSGADMVLSKPIDPGALESILRKV